MILFNLICKKTMFWKSYILTYRPPSPGWGWGLHLWLSLIWYATWPWSEKVEFWPTDSIPRVGGVQGGLWAASNHVAAFVILCNICYQDAAFMIVFNLICNMTMFWKSWILTNPQGRGWGGLQATMLLISWSSLIWYATWPCSEKV